jgi:hypothetical protein
MAELAGAAGEAAPAPAATGGGAACSLSLARVALLPGASDGGAGDAALCAN